MPGNPTHSPRKALAVLEPGNLGDACVPVTWCPTQTPLWGLRNSHTATFPSWALGLSSASSSVHR